MLCAVATSAVAAAPHFQVTRHIPLPPAIRWAQDVRWTGDETVIVSAGRGGVLQFNVARGLSSPATVIRGEHVKGGFFFSSFVAWTPKHTLAASPFGMLAWKTSAVDGGVEGTLSMAATIDVDAKEDSVVVLGADRDAKGTWSPDSAIAWLGSFSNKLQDLQPILYSHVKTPKGPNAISVGNCGILSDGAVRFLPDGSFVIVPGVEPGAFLYDSAGRLEHTWQTERLGFLDNCRVPIEQIRLYQRDIGAREEFLRRHTVLDDVIPIGNDPGLILRSFEGGETRWKVLVLHRDGTTATIPILYSSRSPVAHLRADIRANRAVFLVQDDVDVHDARPRPPELVFAQFLH
jgi:hypothetical protein